jgi:hypothetical protein
MSWCICARPPRRRAASGNDSRLRYLPSHVSSANLDAVPEIAVTHPPDTSCAAYGRAQCITTTNFDGHHPTDKIQRASGPPSGPEIRLQHRRRSQRRIWGQELAPSRSQPPTGGTDGIQPAAGSPTTPGWCRPAHARAKVVVLGLVCVQERV